MVGLPDGEKTFDDMYNRLGRWTDGQTSCHGTVRATHMRHMVKMDKKSLSMAKKIHSIC